MNRDRVRRYVERRDDPTVPQVLGRFELPPSAGDEVRELLGATNRARDRQPVPSNSAGSSCGSRAEREGQEAEKRSTEAGLLRLLRVNGENAPLPLEIEGGEGGRACIGRRHPEKLGGLEVVR